MRRANVALHGLCLLSRAIRWRRISVELTLGREDVQRVRSTQEEEAHSYCAQSIDSVHSAHSFSIGSKDKDQLSGLLVSRRYPAARLLLHRAPQGSGSWWWLPHDADNACMCRTAIQRGAFDSKILICPSASRGLPHSVRRADRAVLISKSLSLLWLKIARRLHAL